MGRLSGGGEGGLGFGGGVGGAALDFIGAGEAGEDFGGDHAFSHEFGEAFFALGEGFAGIALFGEAGLQEGGIDVAVTKSGATFTHARLYRDYYPELPDFLAISSGRSCWAPDQHA